MTKEPLPTVAVVGLGYVGLPLVVEFGKKLPKPLHRQSAYVAYAGTESLAQSERAAERVLSLPMSADLTQRDQDRVVLALTAALAACEAH